jgi:hypothetical protein
MDLRAEKKFRVFKRASISIYADVFNVLNNQVEIERSNGVGHIELQGGQFGAGYTMVSPNLNYGNFTQWYPPTSYFIGAKIEF